MNPTVATWEEDRDTAWTATIAADGSATIKMEIDDVGECEWTARWDGTTFQDVQPVDKVATKVPVQRALDKLAAAVLADERTRRLSKLSEEHARELVNLSQRAHSSASEACRYVDAAHEKAQAASEDAAALAELVEAIFRAAE